MTAQTRVALKAVFEQGDTPQGSDFEDLIDSFLALADTSAQTITSDVQMTNLTVTGAVTAQTAVLGSAVTINTNTVSAASVASSYRVPASAASFMEMTINGSVYAVPFFHKG